MSGKYWIKIKGWLSKSPPAHSVPSGSALSFRFPFIKQHSGFLQVQQHLFWVLRKNLSFFPPRPDYVSALLCSLPSHTTDAGSLLAGSDFCVPIISACTWGAFSTECVQVFSKGNIPSPSTVFHPPWVSSQHEEPGAASSAVQPFKSSTMYIKVQTGKLNIAYYSCLCSFINFYL